jgi:ribonuclease BN (tRNA processing enzyme)
MRITVLGGCGAWPAAGEACSGYLVEHDGFRLLIDPGYACVPRLLERVPARAVDAVVVSHSHPDHCADLHPLLRARILGAPAAPDAPPDAPGSAASAPALAVYALPGAVDRVLALDGPGSLDGAYALHEFTGGGRFEIGPFQVDSYLLPHFVSNAGLRLSADGRVLAYTGDTGPSPDLVALARDADVFLAEATYPEHVPEHHARYLSSALQAGHNAAAAGVGRLVLTHLWPGTDPAAAAGAARGGYTGEIEVARPGLTVRLG